MSEVRNQNIVEIEYQGIRKSLRYNTIIENVIRVCFEIEKLLDKRFTVNVILTTPEDIRRINKEYRKIDKETDVLSFPIFEKDELSEIQKNGNTIPEVLGDIIISIEQVKKQAKEYGHSFERELAYMVVHGFYHCIGYDHIKEEDKKKMREKEETALSKTGLERNT